MSLPSVAVRLARFNVLNGAVSMGGNLLLVALLTRALRLDPVSHRATGGAVRLELGPTEFKLLHFFMTHPDRIYSRAQLLDEVWGDHVFLEERTVDVHIRRLRQALSRSGHDGLIETVRGNGYGLRVAGSFGRTLSFRNVAQGNVTNLSLSGAFYAAGPSVDARAVSNLSAAANADSPWANFEY